MQMSRKIGLVRVMALCAAFTLWAAGTAHAQAQTSTASLNVSASVAGGAGACVAHGGTLSFGAYTGVQKEASGTITVSCTTANVPYSVYLDYGLDPIVQPDMTFRLMTLAGDPIGGSNYIPYALFKHDNTPWGDLASGLGLSTVSTGSMQSHEVKGVMIPRNPLPPAGTYHDTVTVLIAF